MSILPPLDREYLASKVIAFREVTDGSQKGIILERWPLPEGQFSESVVDILIMLPPGYADVPPDMFYTFPSLKLSGADRYPRAADQPVTFAGQSWQRWSRHNSEWRPGIDGIWTMIKRIETAFVAAAA